VTASGTYHVLVRTDGIWASTVAWGRNAEGHHATNALLLETGLTLADRDTWFGRFEVAGKTAHDLDVESATEAFTVGKLQGGYTRYLEAWRGLKPGLGATLSVSVVPPELQTAYGGRTNLGAGVFMTLRPSALPAGGAGSSAGAGRTMIMVMVVTDPARLACPMRVDVTMASKTIYQGTTYYFCSDKDRDDFLKDPAMNVAMMPKP
jgi:YHS domain-containing protein